MLDAEFSEDFFVTGTCDALISSTKNSATMIESSHIVFELKKPSNKENKIKQAKLELLSAGKRSSFDLITVLTDLNDSWTILWLEKMARTRKGNIARICCTEVTRNLAIGFLRYHLKIVAKMRKFNQTESTLDIKYDDEYKDEDDCMDHPNKKQKFLSKSRPTFMASSYSDAVCENRDQSQSIDMSESQLMDIAISNFIRVNKQDFKGMLKMKEKKPLTTQESSITMVQDWVNQQ